MVSSEVSRRQNSSELRHSLDQKYNSTLAALAALLQKDAATFNSQQAMKYIDAIYAWHFDQQIELSHVLIREMMMLADEYYNDTLAVNATTQKVFVTQILTDMMQLFESTQDMIKDGVLEKNENRIKLMVYADHQDALLNLANVFKFTFPDKLVNYSSTLLVELHEIVEEEYFYVNMSINDQEVVLSGQCGQSKKCLLKHFDEFVEAHSFFEEDEEYAQVCGLKPEDRFAQEREAWVDSSPYKIY